MKNIGSNHPIKAIPHIYLGDKRMFKNKTMRVEDAAMIYCNKRNTSPYFQYPEHKDFFKLSDWDKLSNPTIKKLNSICAQNGWPMLSEEIEKQFTGERTKIISDGAAIFSQYDHIGKVIRNTNAYYENEMLQYLKKNYRNTGTIIDLGANIGNHTVFFAKYLNGDVMAIEPQDKNFEYLTENVRLNNLSNVKTVHNAMSLDGRALKSDVILENMGSCNMVSGGDKESITPTSLDKLPKIGLIKIDCEDMSHEIFTALVPTIKKHKCDVIIEALPVHAYEYAKTLDYIVVKQFNATPTFYLRAR